MNKQAAYVIGADFGTDSVRSVLVNALNGEKVSTAVFEYPRWKEGLYCNASLNQFRQHPLDYIEGLQFTVKACLKQAGKDVAAHVKAISVDTTGSTPVAVDRYGSPLALLRDFESDPDAMFVLWKDHTSINEAEEINEKASHFATNYLKYVGGIYSSEWFWAKLLHILRNNEAVKNACYSFVEHCDWIPFLLTGGRDVHAMKRSICAAGHKALWSQEWEGLPPNAFFTSIDPLLNGFTDRLYREVYTSDRPAGKLCSEWAEYLGLTTDVVVGTGGFDAHMGAVGGQIKPNYLCKVIGTSTCDMLIAPCGPPKGDNQNDDVPIIQGICGQVDGSIIPGMIGMEAGQSAFGDVYAWLSKLVNRSIETLSDEAAKLPLKEQDELAIDWLNGRRTPDADQGVKAAIVHLNLGSDAVRIFKALAEATCFGAKAIVERFQEEGIPVKGIIGVGGVAKKSPYVMQVMADVLGMPIKIHKSDQTCAMGAAMFAATVAGIYTKVEDAMDAMGQGFEKEYLPNEEHRVYYQKRYEQYKRLGGFIEQEKHNDVVRDIPKSTQRAQRIASPFKIIREEAYEANMQLPKLGLVKFTFGNVSAADRSLGVFAIKPSGVPYEKLSPENMVIVDFDGNVAEGSMRPSSDTKTHAVLYKQWEEIGGVCHTHSSYATAWAQSLRDIPIFGTTHADHCIYNIPCAVPMDDVMIEGDYEYQTGLQIIQCLQERVLSYKKIEMILVGNHAPFTWGASAEKAVYNSAVLEELAKMALLTEQINPGASILKASLIRKHYERKHGASAYYGHGMKVE